MSLSIDRIGRDGNASEMSAEESLLFYAAHPFDETVLNWITADAEVSSAVRAHLSELLADDPEQAAEGLLDWVGNAIAPAPGDEGVHSLKNPPPDGVARDLVTIALDQVNWPVMIGVLNKHFANLDAAGGAG